MDYETIVYDIKPEGFFPKIEVAANYLNLSGKLLLLELSSCKEERGAWGIPAGKIERGETPVQGARRELFEETGIFVEFEESFHSLGKLYIHKPEIDYVYHLFEIGLDSQPSISLSPEHSSYRWVSRTEAEGLPLMNGGKKALDVYCQRSRKMS